MKDQIRVAVIGGGVAGLTLARALQLQGERIVFDVFESKSSFSERGASVALARNATNILRATGFDVDRMLRETRAASLKSTEAIAAVGEHRGETLFVLDVGGSFSVVRTAWLDQLLSGLPQDRLHVNKRLASIDSSDVVNGPCTLSFTDGSVHEADVVVGCDGIHSQVRKTILGADNKEHLNPVFAGYWDARTVLPLDKAIEGLRSSLFDPGKLDQRFMLIGDGSYMLLVPHAESKTYFMVAAGAAGPDFDRASWKTTLDREFLENAFKEWEDPLKSTVIDSLLSKDIGPGYLFSEWESAPTPTFFRDRLCILGDAAHSIVPWIGQGAALATEDACVLATLLSAAGSTSDITAALQVFNEMSRKRAALALECSRNAAKLSVGKFGLDKTSLGSLEQPTRWFTELSGLDANGWLEEARARFTEAALQN